MSRQNGLHFFDPSKEALLAKDGVIENPYDGSRLYNLKPASIIVKFSKNNSTGVSWSYANNTSVATITHSMNCYPIVQVYDESGLQVYPNIIIVSGTEFKLDFCEPTNPIPDNATWTCTVTFGAEYSGSDATFTTDMETMADMMQGFVEQAAEAAQAAQTAFQDQVKTTISNTNAVSLIVSPGEYVKWTLASDGVIIADMNGMTGKAGSAKVIIDIGEYSVTCGNGLQFRVDGFGRTDSLYANKVNECMVEWDGTGIARLVVLGTLE